MTIFNARRARALPALAMMATVLIGGCSTLRVVAPETVAGYEADGLHGAILGATGVARRVCQRADSERLRETVTSVGATLGADDAVETLRSTQQTVCHYANGLGAVADGAR